MSKAKVRWSTLIGQYGKQAVLNILGDLKNGEPIEIAVFQNISPICKSAGKRMAR